MTAYEQRLRIGEWLRSMRENAGLSQEATAAEMDVGRTTVVRWEAGGGEFVRNILAWKHYCDIMHQDLIKSTLMLVAPEMYAVKNGDIQEKKRALTEYLYEAAPDSIVDILYFIFFAPHGSVPEAVIQKWCADLHTPLHMRHTHSLLITTDYKQAVARGEDPCADWPHPDLELLEAANDAGFAASIAGQSRYHVPKSGTGEESE